MKKALIYFDSDYCENSLELLGVVEKIYPHENYSIHALNISNKNNDLVGVVETIINCHNCPIDPYDYVNITKIIIELNKEYNYQCILFPSSKNGRLIAPRVAMQMHVGLVADITDIQINQGKLEIIRPAYGGKIMAAIECLNEPMLMSVRQNVFSKINRIKLKSNVIDFKINNCKQNTIKLISKIDKNDLIQDIRQSRILVSGGFGIVENFNQIYEFANLLRAHVSASRKIVDHGVASRKIQVGQSGKTVSPELYFALGISGSTQHIEGLRNIETIISVNTNELAPLNSIANVVVLGDAIDFINRLAKIIKKEKKGE